MALLSRDKHLGEIEQLKSSPAGNFAGGKYDEAILQKDTILYRAGKKGGGKNTYGRWFTSEPPASEYQVRIDSAVKRYWTDDDGNVTGESPVESVYAIMFPAGTKIYEGPVGDQGGFYLGGQDQEQIYMESPWAVDGHEVKGESPLKGIKDD